MTGVRSGTWDPRMDAQTGLSNALAFVERLWTAAAGAGRVTLFLLDIDGLSRLNARLGVAAGDRTIAALAGVLRERPGISPYRFGGDEFAALVEAPGERAAAAMARDLVACFAQAVQDLRGSCTIGFASAVAPFHVGSLLWRAERALRTGKAGGGGRAVACRVGGEEEAGADVIRNLVRRLVEALGHLEYLQSEALTDPVSGLPNQRHAQTYLETVLRQNERMAGETGDARNERITASPAPDLAAAGHARGGAGRAPAQPVSIVFLDGDRLRRYNERGYEAGNAMIRHLGAILRATVGEAGFVGRWLSGDEFLVVLPGVVGARALEVAWRLCSAVAESSAG